ncbi:MAG TPA: polysaccharide deacetylase family protein [bacterium]|nr:polysaccharide deacetylase family protein [bacterium]
MNQIVLTFDYELFLGAHSGTAQKCLLEPTSAILQILKEHNATGIFFIDASYLLHLVAQRHPDFEKVRAQIIEMAKAGHDFGLHLHPQWLDAVPLNGNEWTFKTHERYRLQSLGERERGALIASGKEMIEEIVQQVCPAYKVQAFRAGGWCVQPFQELKNHMLSQGLHYDFSVRPGIANNDNEQAAYDFTKAPQEKDYWRFENDPCLPQELGKFFEVPMTSVKISGRTLLKNYFQMRRSARCGDGQGLRKPKPLAKQILRLLLSELRSSTLDLASVDLVMKQLKKGRQKKRLFQVWVHHPKLWTAKTHQALKTLLLETKTLSFSDVKRIVSA